jgi:hypothetical protein
MNYAEKLKNAIGDKSNCKPAPEERLKAFESKLSEDFINLWKTDGWCSYGNGKFWMVDPDVITPLLPKLDSLPPGFIAFARDSFANVFLLVNDEIYRLNVHYNVLNHVAIATGFFFDIEIFTKDFNKKFLEDKKFKAARKKLGDLEADECYTYKLALALGGEEDVENMTKVKFLEQLSILLQLNEE